MISFFLNLKDTRKHTFYKDEVYGSLCNLLGEKKKSAGQKLVHFYELLNNHVIPAVESDTELLDSINKEIDAKGYVHSTPLIAQTALWNHARYVRNNDKTQIWLFLGGKDADDYHFEEMYSDDGVIVIADIGSSVNTAKAVIKKMADEGKRVLLADCPMIEGSIVAAVISSINMPLEEVLRQAQDSKNMKKA